jgi:hypothetical protein
MSNSDSAYWPSWTYPFFLNVAPSRWKSPNTVDPRHLMKSSSIPPAVVTIQSTNLYCAKNFNISLKPDEIKLEVYPRNRVNGASGSDLRFLYTSAHNLVSSVRLAISSTICIARDRPVAWNPIVLYDRSSSSSVIGFERSGPLICTASAGNSSDGIKTLA